MCTNQRRKKAENPTKCTSAWAPTGGGRYYSAKSTNRRCLRSIGEGEEGGGGQCKVMAEQRHEKRQCACSIINEQETRLPVRCTMRGEGWGGGGGARQRLPLRLEGRRTREASRGCAAPICLVLASTRECHPDKAPRGPGRARQTRGRRAGREAVREGSRTERPEEGSDEGDGDRPLTRR